MAIHATALKSFDGKKGEGIDGGSRVRRGNEIKIESASRAKALAARGLVALGNAPTPSAKASTAKTGAEASPSSSPEVQAQATPTSTDSAPGETKGSITIRDTSKRKPRRKK